MKDIYTVIIYDYNQGDISTTSFLDRDDANEYVAEEVAIEGEEFEVDKLLDTLEQDGYYESSNGTKYYVEEARLVEGNESDEDDRNDKPWDYK